MRKILKFDPVWEPIGNFYCSFSRVWSGALLGLLLAGLSAPILAGAATAADMPVKSAATAPAFNWTGCYVGINGGAAASGSSFTSTVNPGTHLTDPADLATVSAFGSGSRCRHIAIRGKVDSAFGPVANQHDVGAPSVIILTPTRCQFIKAPNRAADQGVVWQEQPAVLKNRLPHGVEKPML